MTRVFHPLAEREFIAAARFYETRAPGLGADFIRQVERALSEIVAIRRLAACLRALPSGAALFRDFHSASYTSLSPQIFQ